MTQPIAYTYDADTHCPACAAERFPTCPDGWIACTDDHDPVYNAAARDREGNPVGAIFGWDEWCEPTERGVHILACGTCRGIIREHDQHEPDPDDACDCDNCRAAEAEAERLSTCEQCGGPNPSAYALCDACRARIGAVARSGRPACTECAGPWDAPAHSLFSGAFTHGYHEPERQAVR